MSLMEPCRRHCAATTVHPGRLRKHNGRISWDNVAIKPPRYHALNPGRGHGHVADTLGQTMLLSPCYRITPPCCLLGVCGTNKYLPYRMACYHPPCCKDGVCGANEHRTLWHAITRRVIAPKIAKHVITGDTVYHAPR